ncbi:hypothetical protein [Okeania sp. KiyG1]|nr:hypothetical protein [Okeania sp. KiyG1]
MGVGNGDAPDAPDAEMGGTGNSLDYLLRPNFRHRQGTVLAF